MGSNFHDPWTTSTTFTPAPMNAPLSDLDEAITHLKNILVMCDGDILFHEDSGFLEWTGTLRVLYATGAGDAIWNQVPAGQIALASNDFVYIDLSPTNNDSVTIAKTAAGGGGAGANFLAVNRIVLGILNGVNGAFFPVHLKKVVDVAGS
jgi:hypothetical protein